MSRQRVAQRAAGPRAGVQKVARTAGIVGAALGLAAAGVTATVAAERALVRRLKRDTTDPYADEPFGELPYDETRVVTASDGTDVYVEIVEPDEDAPPRPTVVFVHGYCLDMGTFHFQRRELTRRGEHRIVSYDQPGHGRSGRLESGDYEIAALGDTLRAVLEQAVPDGPIVLVGHSMGGMTIMALAERYPELFDERVAGAVLMATSGGLLDEARLGVPAILSRAGSPLLMLVNNATRLTGGVIDRTRLAASDLSWLLTRRYGFGTDRPSPALVSYVERMNSRTSAETVTRYVRTLLTHSRYPALAVLAPNPTLVIVGDKDMITPVAHSEEIVRRLPDADYVQIADGGHVVMLEHADQVNAALFAFLAKIQE
ncbi:MULTISPECIES: alpha/beta fold hydrolase [unclassified Solwaraspora]|uniref:alpha/beta fold hydrolase n=1 Tax=unclassified Solwaraspora TaxID=2627926 RepID=UPI00259BA793|nr:alpha/beta hydrolase [Solwaraspora sp. WMMA2056]WJK42342.1 alpha/beta hydrolase [Solwaraspora sp. WMMA2056]